MATDLLVARQAKSARLAHILVIEGCDLVFTDTPSIAGTAYCGAGRTILAGLDLPSSIKIGVNVREGLLKDYSTTFTVMDDGCDGPGQVSDLFRATFDDTTADRIFEPILATDTTVSTTLTGVNGTTVDPSGRHIGTERIALASPTRRDFYIHPGTAPAPMEHTWVGGENDQDEMIPLEVTDEIRVWAGRHIALHQLVYDEEDGDWSTWALQHTSGSLIWRGTMQGRGTIHGTSQFKIKCYGPASITRRLLNRSRSFEPRTIIPRLRTEAYEDAFGVVFRMRNPDLSYDENWPSMVFTPANDLTATSNDALQTQVNDHIADAANKTDTNYDGSGTVVGVSFSGSLWNGAVNFTSSGVSIRFTDASSQPASARIATAYIVMHEKYWALLGFDPPTQAALPSSDPNFVQFQPFDPDALLAGLDWPSLRGTTDITTWPGYWVCIISTRRPDDPLGEPDNHGSIQPYNAAYYGGLTSLDPAAQQMISFGIDEFVNIPGQLALPPAATYLPAETRPQIDSVDVDSMGWFLLQGKIARGENQFSEVEFTDYYQVARCAWVNAGGGISLGPDDQVATVIIEAYEDPRAFGFDLDRLGASWLAGGPVGDGGTSITATPLAWFGGYRGWQGSIETRPDLAWRIITRTLLSSGTATGWGSTGDPVTFLTEGDNAPTLGQSSDVLGSDMELADMGLNIEPDAVNFVSFRELHEDTLGETDNPLGLVVAAYARPVQAEELLGSLLQGRGWSFGWLRRPGYKQPRWSGVDFYGKVKPEEVTVLTGDTVLHITESDIAGFAGDIESMIPKVQQHWRSPVDKFTIETRGDVLTDSLTHEQTMLPLDKGAARRHGSTAIDVKDETLSNPTIVTAGSIFDWRAKFRDRHARDVATFLALPNRVVKINVSAPKGQWLYPGQGFLFSNGSVTSLDGQTIGVTTAQCRVLETTMHLSGKRAGSYTIEALMIGIDTSGTGGFPVIWAGSALVSSTVDNGSGSYTFVCDDDWIGAGHGNSDIEAFDEPAWSSLAGDVYVLIRQSFDLVNFPVANHVIAKVTSVTAGTHTLVVESADGTVYDDTLKIITLAEYTDQDAGGWVRSLVSYHTDGTGETHDPTSTAGKKLG